MFFHSSFLSFQARGVAPGPDANSGVSVQAGPRVAALQTASRPHATVYPSK